MRPAGGCTPAPLGRPQEQTGGWALAPSAKVLLGKPASPPSRPRSHPWRPRPTRGLASHPASTKSRVHFFFRANPRPPGASRLALGQQLLHGLGNSCQVLGKERKRLADPPRSVGRHGRCGGGEAGTPSARPHADRALPAAGAL